MPSPGGDCLLGRLAVVLGLALRVGLAATSCDRGVPDARVLVDASESESKVPTRPAYDLDSDIRTRLTGARAELGDDVRVAIERGVFVFVGPKNSGMFDGAVRLAHDALAAYFNGRFSTPPERAVLVYLFSSSARYGAFCAKHFGAKCAESLGLYRRASRDIILDLSPGLATLTHEIVHPIVERDFPTAPVWLDEGLASLYEKPIFPAPGEIHGGPNWRHPRLLAALASPRERSEARLDVLFGMSDAEFRGPKEDLHYAMAREMCEWLDSRGELWDFYRGWRDAAGNPGVPGHPWLANPEGESTFARVVGHTPAEANAEWVKWVRAQGS